MGGLGGRPQRRETSFVAWSVAAPWTFAAPGSTVVHPGVARGITIALVVALVLVNAFLAWRLLRRRTPDGAGPIESYFDRSVDPVALTDPRGTILRVNARLVEETGFPSEVLVGRSLADLAADASRGQVEAIVRGIPRGTTRRVEARIRRSGGRYRQVAIHTVPIETGGSVTGAFAVLRDLTDQKRTERELQSRAVHDYLTGLPNRMLFSERLRHALETARRDDGLVALLYIDLDRFKPVNDRDGHGAGDELLQILAGRLKSTIRRGDSVARLGGDEFGVILENLASTDEALEIARRVLSSIRKPAVIEGKEQQVGASIGVAFSTATTEGPEELVGQADLAMYEVKARGGFGIEVFRPKLQELQTYKRLQLEDELRRGIGRDELTIELQPIVDAGELCVVAFEVLVRWSHPELGQLLPSTFIPIAEESSLIARVDRWVLEHACREVGARIANGEFTDSVYLSVNLSGRHFQEDDIVDAVSDIILRTGFDPDRLQLEITESAAGGDIAKVRRLKALGVKVAIDDFGTGYSSLSYVRDLDVDVLKVDKSFVLGLGADPSAVAIVRTILTLAEMLGLGVIVEGVEDSAQLEQLRGLGGRFIQGYLFGRPMSLEAAVAFLGGEIKPLPPAERHDRPDADAGLDIPEAAWLSEPEPSGGGQTLQPYRVV